MQCTMGHVEGLWLGSGDDVNWNDREEFCAMTGGAIVCNVVRNRGWPHWNGMEELGAMNDGAIGGKLGRKR